MLTRSTVWGDSNLFCSCAPPNDDAEDINKAIDAPQPT